MAWVLWGCDTICKAGGTTPVRVIKQILALTAATSSALTVMRPSHTVTMPEPSAQA